VYVCVCAKAYFMYRKMLIRYGDLHSVAAEECVMYMCVCGTCSVYVCVYAMVHLMYIKGPTRYGRITYCNNRGTYSVCVRSYAYVYVMYIKRERERERPTQ